MSTTAPDLLLSVFVYLAFAILLRIRRGRASWRSFLLLGLVLGFGYLAKNAMLPLAPLFVSVGLFFAGDIKKAGARATAASLGLILIAGPFIVALSVSKHRLTFGDAGKLNYLWHVNRVPPFHWQGADVRYGIPKHPTRKILAHPAVYEFGSPLNATYPPWYDPSYWYDGASARFDFSQQKSALRNAAKVYLEVFSYKSHLVLFGGFLLLAYIGRRSWVRDLRSEWSLPMLSCAAFALYLPVHVEPRYVAAFILPLWLVLFGALRLPVEARSGKLVRCIVVTVAVVIIFAQIGRSISLFRTARTDLVAIREAEFLHLQVAEDLNSRGIKSGDPVGMLNFNSTWLPVVHWARLAHVRIIAELPNTDSDTFAAADDSHRREVIETFARTGAKAVVAMDVPDKVMLPGWERVGRTDYYVLKLR